jgi:hypothetical protein
LLILKYQISERYIINRLIIIIANNINLYIYIEMKFFFFGYHEHFFIFIFFFLKIEERKFQSKKIINIIKSDAI